MRAMITITSRCRYMGQPSSSQAAAPPHLPPPLSSSHLHSSPSSCPHHLSLHSPLDAQAFNDCKELKVEITSLTAERDAAVSEAAEAKESTEIFEERVETLEEEVRKSRISVVEREQAHQQQLNDQQKREEKTRRADQEAHERTVAKQKEEQKIVAQARQEVEVLGERFADMCKDVARLTQDNMAYAAEVAGYASKQHSTALTTAAA